MQICVPFNRWSSNYPSKTSGAQARRRPLAEALRLRVDGAHGETTRDEGSRNLTAVPFSGRSDQDQTVANTR